MKKYLVIGFIVILSLSVLASGIKFSVLTFYTSDLQTGNSNIWPIAYFRIPLTDNIGLNVEDYVISAHDTLKIGNFQIMEPTYWYASYRSSGLKAYIGHFKSKHTLTRQMYLLRVGGFYDTITGAELSYSNYDYDLGIRYDWKYSELAAYAGLLGNNYKLYLYASKGDKLSLSTNMLFNFSKDLLNSKIWAAAAYDVDLSNVSFGIPTILIGGDFSFKVFDLTAQYAFRPNTNAAKIWYDYNDPNKGGYPLQDFNSLLTYKINGRDSIGVRANWNSNLSMPVFGLKFSHGDLSLEIGSGDLNGGISGTQYITLNYSNYFSIPLTTHPVFSSPTRSW